MKMMMEKMNDKKKNYVRCIKKNDKKEKFE